MENATHILRYAGEELKITAESMHDAMAGLIEKHGRQHGIPHVTPIEDVVPVVASDKPSRGYRIPASPEAVVTQLPTAKAVDELVCAAGKARAEANAVLAEQGGFVLADPIYSIGTRMVQAGVDNARQSQIDHDEKPYAQDLCKSLVDRVAAEYRQDSPALKVGNLRMAANGQLVTSAQRYALSHKAFAGLMSRMPCSSGIAYLNDCPTKLRAINFNHWAVEVAGSDVEVVLRTRVMQGQPAVYAAVSGKYTAFDADKIGQALELAFPSDARGVLDYDGERLRVEGLWHSDVAPEEFVAGEIFKAGVIITSDDTGSGSIRVRSVIWRNLCRNLIILDKAIGVDVRLRHMGSVNKLASEFRKAFNAALQSVNGFRVAWGRAMAERDAEFVRAVQGTTREDLNVLSAEAVLSGVFRGVMERELVPLKGRANDVVPKLLEMHRQDEAADAYGMSRASVVNALTRYAHERVSDPFEADAIRAGAGALLSGRKGREPEPLPFVG